MHTADVPAGGPQARWRLCWRRLLATSAGADGADASAGAGRTDASAGTERTDASAGAGIADARELALEAPTRVLALDAPTRVLALVHSELRLTRGGIAHSFIVTCLVFSLIRHTVI